jgi:hypothetical protein
MTGNPYAAAGMAALSIASSIAKNKQVAANARAQALFIGQQASITRNSIIEGSKDVQKQVALQMTAEQRLNTLANSNTAAMVSSHNMFGGVAAKLLNEKEIQATLITSNLQQAGEAARASMFNDLATAKMQYENSMMTNEMNRINNQKGTLEILAGAAGAASGGYSFGS